MSIFLSYAANACDSYINSVDNTKMIKIILLYQVVLKKM